MNTQYIWMIEAKASSTYFPFRAEMSRDGARALQRYLKDSGQLAVPSRIRRYAADNNSRG